MIILVTDPSNANAITHAGVFHADDVLASVLLERVLGDVRLARVFSVPENLNPGTIVFDIGYGEFDHHQPGGNGARENGIPYSSAGLLWAKFENEILKDIPNSHAVWKSVDRSLIQWVDADDNGYSVVRNSDTRGLVLSEIVSVCNPCWDSTENSDEAFLEACDVVRIILDKVITKAASKEKARALVLDALRESDGLVLELDRYLPWKDALFESNDPKAASMLFAVYPDKRNGWNWQCVPDSVHGYGQRKQVPLAWCGLSGEDLQAQCGVGDAVFCHRNGFMGAARTREGAIQMVRLAIESARPDSVNLGA